MGGDPEQGFRHCFTDGHNQSLVSSVAQAIFVFDIAYMVNVSIILVSGPDIKITSLQNMVFIRHQRSGNYLFTE